jgi:FG-GAP-like repeat/PASTA domain/FG-GAP repeat
VFINKGDGSLQPKHTYRTGTETTSVAIGDLNDDGKPDLAAANRYAGMPTVSVLLNRGDGSFGAKHDYAGADPVWVTIGDLNGDGRPELAVANFELHSVSVFANNGDGSFRKRPDYATGIGTRSVAIGDLNGDGRPDLATTDLEANTVSVLVNNGVSFGRRLAYATGSGPVQVAIGDLNGDGRGDAVTADYRGPGTASVLINSPNPLCVVQKVEGAILSAARQTLARAHCRIGSIHRAYSRRVRTGRVISQTPGPYKVLSAGGKVNLVVSRGHKR